MSHREPDGSAAFRLGDDPPLVTVAPQLSVVTTLYRSEQFIQEFYRRTVAAASALCRSFEIVFVDDGSPDNSLRAAIQLSERDSRVRVVELSRNFGHHAALLAGLRYARGAFVFLIDSDLEEQPEWLAGFWNDLQTTGADVVYGVQEQRTGSAVKRHTGTIFYRFFNSVSDVPIPRNGCTVRLMRRSFVDAVSRLGESQIFLMGLFSWTGFSQHPRPVAKLRRQGASTYTPLRLLTLSLAAVTSFSSYPLTIIFVGGAVITSLAVAYAAWLVTEKVLHPDMIVSGFASIMVSLWFLGGTIISVLGVIGIYIGKIFGEAKSRPQYLVRNVYEQRD